MSAPKVHRITDPSSLLHPARYLTECRATLKRIEEVVNSADGFRQVDARERLRALLEWTDNVCAELMRTAVTKSTESSAKQRAQRDAQQASAP